MIGAIGFEQRQDAVAQAAFGHDGLLAGTDRAVIERLARDHFGDGFFQVGRRIHQRRHIAGADAEGRLAAGIRGLDHACAAGGKDHAGARMPHQRVGALHGGGLDALDNVFGRARLERGVIKNAAVAQVQPMRARMRADDDRRCPP